MSIGGVYCMVEKEKLIMLLLFLWGLIVYLIMVFYLDVGWDKFV